MSAESCPGCGGALEHEGVGYAYVTDLPPMPRPEVKGYRVQICRCQSCGKRVRGRHREVAPDQYGASSHRMGKRVMSAAHVLHHSVGVPVRKIPSILPSCEPLRGFPFPVSARTGFTGMTNGSRGRSAYKKTEWIWHLSSVISLPLVFDFHEYIAAYWGYICSYTGNSETLHRRRS